ncbi:MAG TPA: hypothetical protein VFT87_00525 [Candidatus Saccharimonadales bacterium]|nr:hypothetical protein [Candidatus Saccharimonadales bacterium]
MAIKKITVFFPYTTTYEVGGLYNHRAPEHGIITRIEYVADEDRYYTYDPPSVDTNSIVEE